MQQCNGCPSFTGQNHFASKVSKMRQPPNFLCFRYLYRMRIFTHKICLLDIPFKGRYGLVSSVRNFSDFIFTADIISAVSTQFYTWLSKHFRSVNKTAEILSAVTLTLLKQFPRCHWYRWNDFWGVIDTAEIRLTWNMSANTRPYAKQFQPVN
jgi:hypothetical protein